MSAAAMPGRKYFAAALRSRRQNTREANRKHLRRNQPSAVQTLVAQVTADELRTGSFPPVANKISPIGRAVSVGSAGRAETRGVSARDTTMPTTRQPTTLQSIRNPSYVHPVHPCRVRVDAKNRQTARRVSDYVQASTPKCNVHTELKRKTTAPPVSTYKRYADWGGRLDAPLSALLSSGDYLRPPQTAKGGRGGHLSGEVTL